ncbi:MAG: hypothetical protein ABI231_07025 [Candidatus Tumulicola sp.]
MKLVTMALAPFAIVALAACSSHTSTVQTREGAATVTTSQDDKSVTVQTKEATTAIGENVDAAKLGAPVYPGAQANQGTLATHDDKSASVIAAFRTTDAFDKVYDFYKRQLPAGAEKLKVASGNGSIASFQSGGESDQVAVQIASDKPNETDILITHVTKTGAGAASASSASP